MGRSLFGNSVTAAQLVLSQPLGNTGSGVGQFDTNTTSQSADSSATGGAWMMSTSWGSDTYARPRNSVAFQHIDGNNAYFSLQDELSDYTYVQGYAGNSSTYPMYSRVYDANLNVVSSFNTNSEYPNLVAVRLHNGIMYYFRITGNNTLVVTRVIISTGARTDSSMAMLGFAGYNPSNGCAVFNWPINNKYYVSVCSSSTNNTVIYAYNIDTNSIDQVFNSYTGGAISQIFCLHVNSTGTEISVAAKRTDEMRVIIRFNSGGTSLTSFNTSGHWTHPNTGASYTFGTYDSFRRRSLVTTDCIVSATSAIYWDGNTFIQRIAHLRGGDNEVQVFQHYVSGQGYAQYMASAAPHPSTTSRNLWMIQNTPLGNGTYQMTRNGNTLVFTKLSTAYTDEPVANKFSGFKSVELARSGSFLAVVRVTDSINAQTSLYQFAVGIGARNAYNSSFDENGWYTSFVTSTGKFYNLPVKSSNSTSNTNSVKGQIPTFITATTKTYKVTVVGGGGSQASAHGSSSSFAGIAAAAGSNRTGYVAGSTVFGSGPSRGTGGTGYGDDGWGQGEDTQSVGSYGGGSGYVNIGEVTLEANEPYFYVAGLGPQYGKQGVVLLEQL